MRRMMSIFLSFVLLLGNLTIVSSVEATPGRSGFVPSRDCREGSCMPEMRDLYEAKLRAAHQDQCLPPNGANARQWIQTHRLSESCLHKIAELEELSRKLEAVSQYLSSIQDCVNCGRPSGNATANPLESLAQRVAPQCSIERKRQIVSQCDDDALCVLVSGSTFMLPQVLRNRILPQSLQRQGCNGRNDSCLVQFATGFARAVWNLFEGLFDLLKMAGRGVRNAASGLWHWMTGPEAHSSTAQLAAANASQNEGVFRQLINDFPGTMGRIWTALLATIKHWMANSVFCQQWSGLPNGPGSTCTRPAEGFGCTSCRAMITGMCSLTGVIMSEVIPAFLTGGLSVAARYGAEGAVRLARLIRVPQRTMAAVRASRVAQYAGRTAEVVSTAVRTSRVATGAIAAARAAIQGIAPSIRTFKDTVAAFRTAIAASGAYIMRTPAGPVLIVGTRTVGAVGRTLLLPIDNALLRSSFSLGANGMERLLRAGSNGVRVARAGVVSARITDPVESALVRMEMNPTGANQMSYLTAVKTGREARVAQALTTRENLSFRELLDEFYPDLDYGDYSRMLTPGGIETAENDLFRAISNLPDGPRKTQLLRDYQGHLASTARSNLSGVRTFTRENVLTNSALPDERKTQLGLEVSGVSSDALPGATLGRMRDGLRRATALEDSGALHETAAEISEKIRILVESGFTDAQAQRIVRSGVVSRPRPEDLFPALRSVAVPEVSPQMVEGMASSPVYSEIFNGITVERRPAVARALKILEQDGASADRVAARYQRFESHFKRVQQGASRSSDPESLVAQYIRRETQAGKTDAQIEEQLNNAFRSCR